MEADGGTDMTPEERIQRVIGQQAFQIALLQSEIEKRDARIAELEKNQKRRPNGG